jgi:NAD binding domain of 6-phosphogluconate dehydrogenase
MMVSTGKDVKEVLFGANGVMSKGKAPKIDVDSTTIAFEESASSSRTWRSATVCRLRKADKLSNRRGNPARHSGPARAA